MSDDELATVERALAFFAKDLKVSQPTIQWILPDSWQRHFQNDGSSHLEYPIDINGLTPAPFTGNILIRRDLDPAALLRAIAHEMRHIRQEIDNGSEWRRSEFDIAEKEAEEYDFDATRRYPEYVALIEPTDSFSIELRGELELPEEEPRRTEDPTA